MLNILTVNELRKKTIEVRARSRSVKSDFLVRLEELLKISPEISDSADITVENINLEDNMSFFQSDNVELSSSRISIKDVDNLVHKFYVTVTSWFVESEEIALLLQWLQIEKYIFAKKNILLDLQKGLLILALFII